MNMSDWKDLDDGLVNAKVALSDAEQIRKEAHMANGGEAKFDCPKCGGSGFWRAGYPCFKCKGSGAVSKGVMAAAKGKVTKAANIAKWLADHDAEMNYLNQRADRWAFAASMVESVREWGKLTDNQLAAVQRAMAKDAEKKVERAQAREAAAPVVQMSAIEALFDKAVENDIKRPIFRAEGVEISRASAKGKNPGALYVKAAGEYAGKIVGGKFHAVYGAPADMADRLMAVAADPTGEAMKYGRKMGACSCCGRDLVDPVSIRSGIGPVCAEKWGLDWRRDAASDSLREEALEEAAQKESEA